MRIRCISMSSFPFPGHLLYHSWLYYTPAGETWVYACSHRACAPAHTNLPQPRLQSFCDAPSPAPREGAGAASPHVTQVFLCSLCKCYTTSRVAAEGGITSPRRCANGLWVSSWSRRQVVPMRCRTVAPSLRRRILLVADDTHASREVWRACRERRCGPGDAGEPSPGCLCLFDDTAA